MHMGFVGVIGGSGYLLFFAVKMLFVYDQKLNYKRNTINKILLWVALMLMLIPILHVFYYIFIRNSGLF